MFSKFFYNTNSISQLLVLFFSVGLSVVLVAHKFNLVVFITQIVAAMSNAILITTCMFGIYVIDKQYGS